MPDVFTSAKRSAVMKRIRGAGNKGTELRLITLMRAAGVRGWRTGVSLRVSALVVRPDFVFRTRRVAVFVDGCFFHGCPKHVTWPRTNPEFWRTKIELNRARDQRQTRYLRANGWSVVRIWEHALVPKRAHRTIMRLQRILAGKNSPR